MTCVVLRYCINEDDIRHEYLGTNKIIYLLYKWTVRYYITNKICDIDYISIRNY